MLENLAVLMFVLLFFVFWVLVFALIVGSIVLFIWMLVDCVRRKFRNDVEKIVWILILVFTGIIGALVYWIAVVMNNPKGLSKR